MSLFGTYGDFSFKLRIKASHSLNAWHLAICSSIFVAIDAAVFEKSEFDRQSSRFCVKP